MEGLNIAAFLAGFLAVFVFGITSLMSFGLLIVRHTRTARIVFAGGLLSAAVIAASGILSFFAPEFYHQADTPLIVVTSASLLLAGAGQFVAAFRGARTYAAAFGCTTLSLVLVVSPLLGVDWGRRLLGGLGLKLAELGVPLLVAASLLPAVVSVGIAVWSIQNHGSRVAPR